MKLIVAGSRTINDLEVVRDAVDTFIRTYGDVTEIVSGNAYGVDQLGLQVARDLEIRKRRFIPDWRKNGRRAGILRNIEMADYVERSLSTPKGGLCAIWDGESKGTKHMIEEMTKRNLPVYVRFFHRKPTIQEALALTNQ